MDNTAQTGHAADACPSRMGIPAICSLVAQLLDAAGRRHERLIVGPLHRRLSVLPLLVQGGRQLPGSCLRLLGPREGLREVLPGDVELRADLAVVALRSTMHP